MFMLTSHTMKTGFMMLTFYVVKSRPIIIGKWVSSLTKHTHNTN